MSEVPLFEFRERFFRDGYVVVPRLVPGHDVEAIRADAAEIVTAALAELGEAPEGGDLDTLYLQLKQLDATQKGRAYDLMGQMLSLRAVFAGDTLAALARAVLGSVGIVDHTQLRMDDSSNDRILPMHQEVAQMSLVNVTVWIPLQDVRSEDDGGLRVIPGSHTRGFLPHRLFETPHPYYGVQEEYFDPDQEHRISMGRGDALLFHPLLIHGSVPNHSERIRWTMIGRINGLNTLRYLHDGERHYSTDRSESEYQIYNTSLEWS